MPTPAMKSIDEWQRTIVIRIEGDDMNRGLHSSFKIAERMARTKQAERNIMLDRLKKESLNFETAKMYPDSIEKEDI